MIKVREQAVLLNVWKLCHLNDLNTLTEKQQWHDDDKIWISNEFWNSSLKLRWDEVVASSSTPQPTATSKDITYSQMSLNVNFCLRKLWTFPSIHFCYWTTNEHHSRVLSTVCGMLRTRKSRKTGLRSRMTWHSHPRRHSRHSNKKLKQKAIIFRSKHWLFVRRLYILDIL